MANARFLKKYQLRMSLQSQIYDVKLLNPINKSIKATQIYNDCESIASTETSSHRVASMSPRINRSVILDPLPEKYRNELSPDPRKDTRYTDEGGKLHSSQNRKTLKDECTENRMQSQFYRRRSPKHTFF
jgi:hypothetical protein